MNIAYQTFDDPTAHHIQTQLMDLYIRHYNDNTRDTTYFLEYGALSHDVGSILFTNNTALFGYQNPFATSPRRGKSQIIDARRVESQFASLAQPGYFSISLLPDLSSEEMAAILACGRDIFLYEAMSPFNDELYDIANRSFVHKNDLFVLILCTNVSKSSLLLEFSPICFASYLFLKDYKSLRENFIQFVSDINRVGNSIISTLDRCLKDTAKQIIHENTNSNSEF